MRREYDLLPRNKSLTQVKSLDEVTRLKKEKKKEKELENVLSASLVQCKLPYSRDTSVCVFARVRESSVFTHLLPAVVSFLFGLPPPPPLPNAGSFSGQISGRPCEINLRENKQRSTTTNTVNCLSASLAGAAR